MFVFVHESWSSILQCFNLFVCAFFSDRYKFRSYFRIVRELLVCRVLLSPALLDSDERCDPLSVDFCQPLSREKIARLKKKKFEVKREGKE